MQKTKRILVLLLVAALTVMHLPVVALATSAVEGGEIIAFDTLLEETANQTVALGTSPEDLNLPDTLNATVRVVTAVDTKVLESDNETVQDSGEPETIEMDIPIPVEWASSPDYDGENAGAYTFTAQIEGFMVSATPPSITVTVGAAADAANVRQAMPLLAGGLSGSGENLLVNPGAESGNSDVGWLNESGPVMGNSGGGRTGNYFQIRAQGYVSTNSIYYQDVDISSLGAQIDAGLIMIRLNGYYFKEGNEATDQTKIRLEMLDAGGNVVAGPFERSCSTEGGWPALWEAFAISEGAVSGTRTLRVTMDAYVNGGGVNITYPDGPFYPPHIETIYHHAGFDDMSLTAVEDTSEAPAVSAIASQVTDSGSTLGPLGFTVSDTDTDLSSLTVSAYSSNQTLIPDANIEVSLSGANGTISLRSVEYEIGEADVTIAVSDGKKTTRMRFRVTVYPAIQIGSNIVINGDGTSITGWTNPEGRCYSDGDKFIVGTVSSTEYFMYQDVDVTRFSNIFDKGMSRFTASCDATQGGKMRISGLDANGSTLWTKISGSLMDAGTRKIRVSIGGPKDATVDNVSVILQNTLPTLKSGVPTTASARVTYGDTYTLDLSDIFTDVEGGPLYYKVSLNKAPAEYISSSLYSYTPKEAGTTTHKFLAHDNYNGFSDDNNRYLVTLTAGKKTPTAADLTYSLANKTYNGLAQPLNVTGPVGLGTITVKYNGSAAAPKDAATYAVTVSIAEGTNYAATTADIALGYYTIAKAPLTITGGAAATKTYDGTTSATLSAITFDGLKNSETLAIVTDYAVTEAAFDSADAGGDKTVTGTVVLADSGTARNYILSSTSLNLTGQSISKAAAPTGVNQMLEVPKNHSQDYAFDLTTLLPAVSSPKSLGMVAYVPSITANGDGLLRSLNYTSGNTLTIPVNPIAAANKTATIKVTVKSTNYADFDAVITVKTVDVDTAVNIAAITGITAPVRSEVPVTAITQTEQYTGTVTWNPAHDPFAPSTVYTATITLTPKAGYTLTGVAKNFFTVAGATSVSNEADSGVITATFPITLTSDEEGCLVTYQGAQTRYNEGSNTYDIRFVATIDTLNAKEVGFVFSKSETTPTRENAYEKATSTVYEEITASGSPVTAESLGGKYIIACTVTGIPATDSEVPLHVRAFSTVGTETKYTAVRTVTVSGLLGH